MRINIRDNNLIVKDLTDFNLHHIFDCGQCFRFNSVGENSYFGVAKNKALLISQENDEVIFHSTTEADFYDVWYDYFDLNRDYGKIKSSLASDDVMREAISYGKGIRILNQDLWETVISFIISASNNIPRIKSIIECLCQSFGNKITYMGNEYYTFPDAETISSLSRDDLSVIRSGFRDKYIFDAAKKFTDGTLCAEYIKSLSTSEAKQALMTVNGIGNKVSDCILLFGLGRSNSFPVDVWIKRIMEHFYFDGEQSIGTISDFAEKKFGELGGYAQQYLFFYARENKLGIK